MARRAAQGTGTIRKKTITRSGKKYEYWEARYTAGRDPGTGKQIQHSITGKTQKEVAQKLKAATASIDAGTYFEPEKITVGDWIDTWLDEYLGKEILRGRSQEPHQARHWSHQISRPDAGTDPKADKQYQEHKEGTDHR